MFKCSSTFYFNVGLKVAVDTDLISYYMWHLYRGPHDTLGQTQSKTRGAHISVTLPLHGERALAESKRYDGEPVDFWYDGAIRKGGKIIINGGKHVNYWFPVTCPRAEEIKAELGIVEPKFFLGLHLTLSTNKSRLKSLPENL